MQLFTIEKGAKNKLTVYKIKQQKETDQQSNQAKFMKFRSANRGKNEEYIRYMYSAVQRNKKQVTGKSTYRLHQFTIRKNSKVKLDYIPKDF